VTYVKTSRNIGIILLIAAVVDLAPAGGTAWNVLMQAIALAFFGTIAWLGVRLYRERRVTLYSLGPARRAILYGALGLATLALTGTNRLWSTSAGSIAWLVLRAIAAYALYWLYRSSRQY
jgi:TRAP-type C4-dicarboxylate transport system permease small subunit